MSMHFGNGFSSTGKSAFAAVRMVCLVFACLIASVSLGACSSAVSDNMESARSGAPAAPVVSSGAFSYGDDAGTSVQQSPSTDKQTDMQTGSKKPSLASDEPIVAVDGPAAVSGQAVSSTTIVDKSNLEDAIFTAWEIDGSQYPVEKYVAMRAILSGVSVVYEDANASQQNVDQATVQLKAAMDDLSVDKAVLGQRIQEAWEIDGTVYTAESYSSMRSILDNAGAVYNSPTATQVDVENASAGLSQAIGGLTPAPVQDVQTAQVETGQMVYITDTGKKYHRSGCRYLKDSSNAVSLDQALSLGLDPCKVCRP